MNHIMVYEDYQNLRVIKMKFSEFGFKISNEHQNERAQVRKKD